MNPKYSVWFVGVLFLWGVVGISPNAAVASPSPLTQETEKPHVAVGAWWLEGAGAFVVTASIVTLALGYGSFSDADALQKKNPDGSQNTEVQSLQGTGLALTTAGWIALGVGAAMVVAGTIWLVTDRSRAVKTSPASSDSASVSPVSTPQGTVLLFDSQHPIHP